MRAHNWCDFLIPAVGLWAACSSGGTHSSAAGNRGGGAGIAGQAQAAAGGAGAAVGASGTAAAGAVAGAPGTAAAGAAAALSHASAVATDGSDVYWLLGNNQIQRQSVDGGATATIGSDPCGGVESLAVDDSFVYWSHGYTSMSCTASVMRMPKQGGSATTIATGLVFSGQGGIVLDARAVYFVAGPAPMLGDKGPGPVSVYVVPKTGGVATTIPGSAGAAGAPAVDGRNVYWVASDSAWTAFSAAPKSGSIMRAPVDGGSPIILATITRNVTALFFFGDRLYWAASGYHGIEYRCIDCESPATVESLSEGESSPATELTMPAGVFIVDAVADGAALWLSIEGTRSGQGADYPPNDDHTGSLLRAPRGGTTSAVLTGLPFTNELASDGRYVFAIGGGPPVSAAK